MFHYDISINRLRRQRGHLSTAAVALLILHAKSLDDDQRLKQEKPPKIITHFQFFWYTRIVNGFVTDEEIGFNGYYAAYYGHNAENGNVHFSESSYSKEDLANMPDLGEALANMDLSQLQPPNIVIGEDMQFVSSTATGIYRKVEDQVYGIIRVLWGYDHINPDRRKTFVRDECYYLYDQEGNGSIVERSQLEELFDDRWFDQQFPYASGYSIIES